MALAPRAGTGDSVGRIRRYLCSTVLNFGSYFFVCDDVYIRFPPPIDIPELLPNIQKVGLFYYILGLFPSKLSGTI